MQIDTLRALFTYSAALVVLIGGGIILYVTPDPDLRVMVGGFMGAAIQFLFGTEIATRTARQSTAATLAATTAVSNGNGNSNSYASPPQDDPKGPG